ncbi:nucleotide exchange factor GrpE [Aerococcaceae bacterium DSM 111020]|nr:nucleotide exchange factor GrpE [Aerococcaceae bacterium DSM 111020]
MTENNHQSIDETDITEEEKETEAIEQENADVEEQPTEIEKLEKKNEELEDRVLRLQAEISNMQRRNTKERQDASKYRSQALATSLLDALDNLHRALETEVEGEEAKTLHKGVEMVLEQINRAFEEEKITAIDPLNEPFNPEYHQAVSMVPGEEGQESQSVIQVLQKGYILNDRVIRPAMVIVVE